MQLLLACLALLACHRFPPTDERGTLGGDPGAASLTAFLSGASGVPEPGDPDGRGAARITFHGQRGDVCFEITVVDIDSAFAAHVHEGIAGVVGHIAIPLDPPTAGSATGCTSGVSPSMMATIDRNPTDFYVDIHTLRFPDGALRGQFAH